MFACCENWTHDAWIIHSGSYLFIYLLIKTTKKSFLLIYTRPDQSVWLLSWDRFIKNNKNNTN